MAFKLKAPYQTNTTPVYHIDEEDGVLGVYSGSEAYSVEISKGDIFETVGKQDSEYWWFVKKVDKTPMRYNMRNQFNERKNKDNVNIDFDELILTFPKLVSFICSITSNPS